ncbi:hypothetical protein RchiOBHm_Chr7g0239631 [Rosa chinensis]|uniref:Uncharacterized protein n=1 Tax=Rosa chinensis TaxID=74649 RepID=A0A2P6PHT0_ROSCH|nr:hypothetical protein RchiOBHm_Chr7g0239631 [Rosa chinensis]
MPRNPNPKTRPIRCSKLRTRFKAEGYKWVSFCPKIDWEAFLRYRPMSTTFIHFHLWSPWNCLMT